MTQRYKTKAELNSKVIRVSLGQYGLLSELSRRAGVTMSEALDLALKAAEPVTKVSPAQIPIPLFFKPKSISSNGAAHINLKSIREV
jgi:hypothetical protein